MITDAAPFSLSRYYRSSKAAVAIDRFIITLIVLIIFFAPLPFGSVQSGSLLILEVVAGVCFLLWISKLILCGHSEEALQFRELHRNNRDSKRRSPFFHRHRPIATVLRIFTLGLFPKKHSAGHLIVDPPTTPFSYFSLFGYPVVKTGVELPVICFLVLLALQTIPIPDTWVALISPSTADLYRTAYGATGSVALSYPLSVDSFATFSRIVEYLSYFLLYLVTVNIVRSRSYYFVLVTAIVVSGCFQAMYGLYEYLSGEQQIFGYQKQWNLDSATGTFINRNHFASYLEITLPLLCAVVAIRVAGFKKFSGNVMARLSQAAESEGSVLLLLTFFLILCGVALLFSLSRSGISFAALSCFIFVVLYGHSRGRRPRKSLWFLAAAGIVALALWIGLDPLLYRFGELNEEVEKGARARVWKDTWNIFLAFPLTGTGGGTFQQVFPMYRTFVTPFAFLQAHNDYLQWLSEIGIAAVFLIAGFMTLVFTQLRRVLDAPVSRQSALKIGVFCALLATGLHAATDFSLQIPAIALTVSVLLGLFFVDYHA